MKNKNIKNKNSNIRFVKIIIFGKSGGAITPPVYDMITILILSYSTSGKVETFYWVILYSKVFAGEALIKENNREL